MCVYGYCRVPAWPKSGDDSAESQQWQIETFGRTLGLQLTDVFVEAGVSNAVSLYERPVGGPLLDALLDGDVVIAPRFTDMFGSARDAITIGRALEERNVRLYLLDLERDPLWAPNRFSS
jgi:putative DNA-invertase from lambdoid prophage Rac